MRKSDEWAEPAAEDLAAIERESDLIDAEIDLVDAEIRLLTAEPWPSVLDWHRLRRAEARVMRELVKFHAAGTGTSAEAVAA